MRGILSTGVLANMAQWQDRTFEKRCILCSGFVQASTGSVTAVQGNPARDQDASN